MSDEKELEAYCVRCKTKRVMANAAAVYTAKGQPAVQGVCPECATKMFRMGATTLHHGMTPPPKPQPTGKLVIVESPTKARTVGRFLGKGYVVKASVGHIRDLLRSHLSVDVDNDFAPKYRVPNEKRAVVKELKTLAAKSAEVYLATDPDREGEAIAWHLSEELGVQPEQLRRVVFHEITSEAVGEAFAHPHGLNMDLVDAQQARRILDRLVGYNLSPLLWRKIRGRLSAGRVQSVAVRLIVEREREIEAFVSEEYWTIDAELASSTEPKRKKQLTFKARLAKIAGEDVALSSAAQVEPLTAVLAECRYVVSKVKEGERRRRPAAPYTTSTMQQEAARKLGFAATRTMRAAQQLYEGIDLGNGQDVGLITYMRTDSTNIAESAQTEARQYITEHYGANFMPEEPPKYKTRAKGAQEAHEAIRPTSILRTPDVVKDRLTREQYRLYDLIWRRFVASQMTAAVYENLSVEILAGKGDDMPYLFRASGSTLRFPGFLVVYEETEEENGTQEKTQILPKLALDALLTLIRLLPEQHFTQPPPRYTDATLIRALEEYGIGRPSTYAPTLSTIQQRGYVRRDQRRFYPTQTGIMVNDLLVEHFPDLINVDFTAQLEQELDDVAEGNRNWVAVLREFYAPFDCALQQADSVIPQIEQVEYAGRDCPECGKPLVIRWGRYGKFIGCSRFPECRYTEPWLEKIGVTCPVCNTGEIVIKRTKKGREFYGCARWPECEFTSWKRPLARPCPTCGGLLFEARKDTAKCQSCEAEFQLDEIEVGEAQPLDV